MNGVDVALILVVLFAIWGGWQRGFISGALSLIAWLGSLLLGLYFYPYVADFIEKQIASLGVWTLPVAFISTIIIARIILSFITYAILQVTPPKLHQNELNHFLGIIPGFINGVVYAIIISALLLAFPIADGLSEITRESRIANR